MQKEYFYYKKPLYNSVSDGVQRFSSICFTVYEIRRYIITGRKITVKSLVKIADKSLVKIADKSSCIICCSMNVENSTILLPLPAYSSCGTLPGHHRLHLINLKYDSSS